MAVEKTLGGWRPKCADGKAVDGSQPEGARTYRFFMLSPSDSVRAEVVIAKTIGEPLFKAFADTQGAQERAAAALEGSPKMGKATMKAAIAKLASAAVNQQAEQAIALLASRLDQEELLDLMKLVFKRVELQLPEGGWVTCEMDIVFQADERGRSRNKEMWAVFIEALKVNFGDFFDGVL